MSIKLNVIKIAIIPDNFAFYRIPVFKEIASLPNVELIVYSPRPRGSPGSVEIPSELNHVQKSNSFPIKPIRHVYFGKLRVWTQNLLKIVSWKNYDLIICWGEAHNVSTWLALFLAKLINKKIVLWTHGMYGNEKIIKKKARIIFYNLADALLLYGNKAKNILEKEGINSEKMFVIYNSLNYEKQKKIRNAIQESYIKKLRLKLLGIDADKIKMLLHVGRMIDVRKLDVALKALKKLNQPIENYRLVVIGEGPKKKEYEILADKLGISHTVKFKGEIYKEDELAPYFLAADLGISPGSVGLFAVHAHAYGLPVCTHDSYVTKQKPEHEIIIEGKTGFFFKERNAGDLALKIKNWFERMPNYENIRRTCIEQIEKSYNPKVQANIFCQMLQYLGLRNRKQSK